MWLKLVTQLKEMNLMEMNVLVLAYLGDTVYENYVRRYLISLGITNVNELQKRAVTYVSAKRQSMFVRCLIEQDFFTNQEIDIIKRARNYKTCSHPKNTSIIDYKYATGLESLLGFLTLDGKEERVATIMQKILGGTLC